MRNFRKYEVWQNAIELTDSIYSICESFPNSELYGLKSQIQRASVSVAANIAEGAARSSKKDFKRILEIALGSAYELDTLLIVANKRSFISEQDYLATNKMIISIQKQLTGLINSLR